MAPNPQRLLKQQLVPKLTYFLIHSSIHILNVFSILTKKLLYSVGITSALKYENKSGIYFFLLQSFRNKFDITNLNNQSILLFSSLKLKLSLKENT